MDRRWIRIDQAHRALDAPAEEFEAILKTAKSPPPELASIELENGKPSAVSPETATCASEEAFQLLEAINAELAQLASIQRRDRFLRAIRDKSADDGEKTREGTLLADLHALSLAAQRVGEPHRS
jgi:DNA-directed RNA polymerase subunit H (RpoH/RPB5)